MYTYNHKHIKMERKYFLCIILCLATIFIAAANIGQLSFEGRRFFAQTEDMREQIESVHSKIGEINLNIEAILQNRTVHIAYEKNYIPLNRYGIKTVSLNPNHDEYSIASAGSDGE